MRGNNPAELTNEDREAINQMLLICGAELSSFLGSHPSPKNDYKKFLKFIQSRKNIAVILFFLNLPEPKCSLYDAAGLNKKLAKDTGHDVSHDHIKDSQDFNKYLDKSSMSKALKTLVDENLLLPTVGKEALKKVRHIQGEKKYREYKKKFARGGFISIYEISPDVVRLREVISKPQVAKTFQEILKKYSPFREYIRVLLEYYLYMIRKGEETKQNIYELTKGANSHLQIDSSSWEEFREWLDSLDEKRLEQVKEKLTSYMLDNAANLHHVIYRLYELPEIG